MERFKNILVATSPGRLDPPALSAAVNLAHVNDARLTVIDVVAPLPPWRKTVNVEGRIVDLEAAISHDREERLRQLLETTTRGPEVEVVESVGEPFIEVIRQILTAKNVPCWVDFWGHDVNHDWPWWHRQMNYFLNCLYD